VDRLNFFNPFIHKDLKHEDRLTRAFLILLRYEPLAQSLFLELIHRNLSRHGLEVPTLGEINHTLAAETQVQKLPPHAFNLISVLITDESVDQQYPVEWVSRDPIYDGVMDYGDWLYIIENKLSHTNVWKEQLSPGLSSVEGTEDINLIPLAACVSWEDVFQGLYNLEQTDAIGGAGKKLLADFLELVDLHFTRLVPYPKFNRCGNVIAKLERRVGLLKNMLSERSNIPIVKRAGRYPILQRQGGIAEEVAVWVEKESEDSEEWVLKQGLWPADTVGQAKRYYEQMDISALTHLKDAGWEIGLNLHFSFGGTQLVHHHSDINPEVYFNLWAKHQIRLGQYSTEPDVFNHLMDDLERNGLIGQEQVKLLEDKFLHTRRQHINVIPGFAFVKTMKSMKVLALDNDNQLEDQILQGFETALNTWGETLYIQDIKK
jgi:hypothetical protein